MADFVITVGMDLRHGVNLDDIQSESPYSAPDDITLNEGGGRRYGQPPIHTGRDHRLLSHRLGRSKPHPDRSRHRDSETRKRLMGSAHQCRL